MQQNIVLLTVMPFAAAFVALLLGTIHGKLRNIFCIAAMGWATVLSGQVLSAAVGGAIHCPIADFPMIKGLELCLEADALSGLMAALISLLGLLATLYSWSYMDHYPRLNRFYALLLAFVGSMNGTVLAGDLFTMFFFWELMAVIAFLLVAFDEAEISVKAAAKYFILAEAGALLMIVSIVCIFLAKGTAVLSQLGASPLVPGSGMEHLLVGFFLIGVIVKAGIFPLHTWLPDAHPAAPSPISALLSGVMIKVGVYMLVRVVCQIYGLALGWQTFLGLLGAVTLLVGVMCALVQHDAKRLLAFHSVSQVGYMLLGIGLGTTLGVAGGLFHLLNHACFKALLFLCVGAVIYRTKTRNLDELGGLAKDMPLTFVTCAIAAMSISGVPPFNGFASKWMIYQAALESPSRIAPFLLVVAVFGSALTAASFLKLVHAVFWGRKPAALAHVSVKEVPLTMTIPMALLALLCVVFGLFATLPVSALIAPAVGAIGRGPLHVHAGSYGLEFPTGCWAPGLATMLLLIGLAIGLAIYGWGKVLRVRRVRPFIGGEQVTEQSAAFPGTAYYRTVEQLPWFKAVHADGKVGAFDVYRLGGHYGLTLVEQLRRFHTGALPVYVSWCVAGLVVIALLVMLG